MANHSLPTLTSTYSNFIVEVDGRFDDLAVGLDPAVTSATNVPTNSIRWNSVSNKWQKYNGSSWVDLTSTYAINISGSSGSAVNLSTTRSNWASNGTISAVVGQLAWKNFSNGHTIFDASAGTSPDGTSVNSTNASVAWSNTYPTLMGWNGSSTYGVRVDSARVADTVTNGVYTTGDQTIGGNKTFTNSIISHGDITAYSDERLKENWRDFDDDFIFKLSQVKYGIYDRIDNGLTQVGVSAQSLRNVLPNAVNENENGLLSVNYANAALASVIKLSEKIIELELQIKKLKKNEK